MPDISQTEIDLKKLALEERKFHADQLSRDRTFELQKAEIEIKLAETRRSRLTNPLSLAVIGAFVAGIASIAAQFVNGNYQISADANKHRNDMETESFKAESARILEALRSGDPDKAACNLRFFLDAGLISKPKTREFLQRYIAARNGGSGVYTESTGPTDQPVTGSSNSSQVTKEICATSVVSTTSQSNAASQTSTATSASIQTYSTEWIGGGHNQNEACERGLQEMKTRFPTKTVERLDSGEESRKDFFGHVTYRYSCRFRING